MNTNNLSKFKFMQQLLCLFILFTSSFNANSNIITSFSVEATMQGGPTAGINITQSPTNNELVFTSTDSLFGLNITVSSISNIELGTPVLLDANMLMVTNINDSMYNIGICTAYPPANNTQILKIPYINANNGSITFNMIVNNDSVTQTLSGISMHPPTIVTTPANLDFGNVQTGTTSTPKTYTVSGTNLTADITITSPTGYQVCTTSGGTYTTTLTLPQTAGSVATTTVYVKFSPVAVQAYNDNITNATTGAVTQNVAVTGAGVAPVMIVTPAYQNVADTSGTTTFAVSTTGGGTLNWTVSENAAWFSVNPVTGINNETITVTYDANTGGARSDTITITDNDGYNNPVKVVVNQDANSCPSSLSLQDITVTIGQTETYQTSASITAAGSSTYYIINGNGTNGGDVTMASNAITLNHGFDAQKGSVFLAHISPCSSPDIKPKDNVLGNIEYEKLSVRIFPNPNEGMFFFEVSKNVDDLTCIEISNLVGRIIYKKENIEGNIFNVDISEQPSGLYFVKTSIGEKQHTSKIIKN